jgi:hypothetical protein
MPTLWGDYLAKAFKNKGFVRWSKGKTPSKHIVLWPHAGPML